MFSNNKKNFKKAWIKPFYNKGGLYIITVIILFILIGLSTTIKPTYRFSSETITKWTSDIDSSTFLYIIGMENKAFEQALPEDKTFPNLSTIFFQIITNIKIDDPRSLLGHELPGFSTFGHKIIIAGEGTSYDNLSIESSPPLDEVLKDREAVLEELPEKIDTEKKENHKTTGDKDVVFIYNTHNRESFLPHLPGVTSPASAHHDEVNITKVSERLANRLTTNGIGNVVDQTDIASLVQEKNWDYTKSYAASRPVVEEAVATNGDLQYVFDIHRDSLPREKTTKKINGEEVAKILFVIGAEYTSYEKNLSLATDLHYLIEEKYPGLSRGVLTKKGAGTNGIFNQDLSKNALLIEFGGYDNTLEELYRMTDILAEVFSDYYWDAEKVDTN